MAEAHKPYRLVPKGIMLAVRVTPNAGAERIEGLARRDDGQVVLKLRVAAVADKGKANAAVIALLARALGVPKSAISVVSGATARLKSLAITGDGAVLAARIDALAG